MADDSFILVNLKEKESKTIAQVLSNETSRKILDYLALKDEATETQMAKELNIPLSTIHYNLKHLKKARLIEVEEFHYSSKGKEVDHYKLANKLVIIAPAASKFEDLKAKLGKILPVFLVSFVGAFLVYVFGSRSLSSGNFATNDMLAAPMAKGAGEALEMEMQMDAAPMLASRSFEAVAEQAPVVVQSTDPLTVAIWFFIGAMFAALCISLFSWIRIKYKK